MSECSLMFDFKVENEREINRPIIENYQANI